MLGLRPEMDILKIDTTFAGQVIKISLQFRGIPQDTLISIQLLRVRPDDVVISRDLLNVLSPGPTNQEVSVSVPAEFGNHADQTALRLTSPVLMAANGIIFEQHEVYCVRPVLLSGWQYLKWQLQPKNWFWWWKRCYWQ